MKINYLLLKNLKHFRYVIIKISIILNPIYLSIIEQQIRVLTSWHRTWYRNKYYSSNCNWHIFKAIMVNKSTKNIRTFKKIFMSSSESILAMVTSSKLNNFQHFDASCTAPRKKQFIVFKNRRCGGLWFHKYVLEWL